uniref:Bromodomain adjacent to zinc finger domain protein 1A n=1 Tax=Bombyx mori TaxID=7091 RepID=A0A8R2R3S8_BOMMO|nr:bromodomain adjacent to zinc finger domain protein 1A isoform X2 [Bombyx mori]
MPLLKRKAFEKSTASEYLRDDDEVFHCEITDEIFKDYEEYCERIILVNSMVWTCEMTGKNNLTYSEALASEKAARNQLKDFPMELRIPILYLAARTNRCSFAEMSEDVFNFVRDRYFVGETIEACLEGDHWTEAHILSVTAQKQHPDSKAILSAASYVYEVEQYTDATPSTMGQIGTAPFDRVRRRKGIYSRDKNRLFLKQFVEHGPGGVICIKKSALNEYNISKVSFSQIFTGNPPEFESSKKLLKSPAATKVQHKPASATKLNKSLKKPSPDKKGRQESMDKFLKKTEKTEAKPKMPVDPAAKKSAQELAEKMRRAEDQMRQRKEEEKAKKKEKNARLQAYLKEWQKVKDDLELEDHKMIPKGTPIDIEGISQSHIGDFLSVLEFVHLYSNILKSKDFLHGALDIETLRKALTMKEHSGVFCDIIQMFLTTIFGLQEDEAEDYNENGGIHLSNEDKEAFPDVGVAKAVELATKASKWSQTYLGTPLSKLPMDALTVSEILRLHLLSSGAAGTARGAAWRASQRGGYSSLDDPGLRLRRRAPQLLVRLAKYHVAELGLDDKFEILQCLMNQILTYATVRDVIEEKLEEHKNSKQALRLLQINERKREAQLLASKQDLKKEAAAKKEENKLSGEKARAIDEQLKVDTEKLNKENDEKKKEYEKKLKELQIGLFDYSSYLGMDRAYRRYWLNQAVAGLFVEAGTEPRGPCRDKPLPSAPEHGEDTLTYVTRLFETEKERASSDKENDSAANSRGNSPKKPLTNINGLTHRNGFDDITQQLLICSGDLSTCKVHGKVDRPQWWVYHTEEQIEALIQSLNKRGIRESELRQSLELDKDNIIQYLRKCPVKYLNGSAASSPPPPAPHYTRRRPPPPSLTVPRDSSLAEAVELVLRDYILDLEEKIHYGCLGALKVKDREAWRGTIMLRGYDKQADYLTWGPNQMYRDDYHQPNGVLNIPQDLDETELESIPVNKYRDPGYYLEAARVNGVKVEGDELKARRDVIRGLACALLQVSQAIHAKYLKRPLGWDEKGRARSTEGGALARWQVSLLECGSAAGARLHAAALHASVCWRASVLRAACRLCRRRADPHAMLLCDACNAGHHLYCLTPPLQPGELKKVPEGDWFCDQCKPKEHKRSPRKKRKLYSEEDVEEPPNSEAEAEECEDEEGGIDAGVCAACGSGGRLRATCRACAAAFHAECAEPRPPPGAARWLCAACLAPTRAMSSVRRCAATALSNIHQYTRALHASPSSESEDSDYNTTLVKLKKRKQRHSNDAVPLQNGTTPPSGKKRGRKPKHEKLNMSNGKDRRSKNSLTNGVHEERAARGPDAVQQLLRDVIKHKDSWPFYEPVSIEDVPDYLDVIDQPMDLTTIKEKLEKSQYSSDEELIADIALIFHNCYTYNTDTHPVAKAGGRLEKFVNKRCAELDLPSLPELSFSKRKEAESQEHSAGPSSDDEDDLPIAKRKKHK